MNLKRIFSLTLILWALVAFVIPVSASAADNTDDLSVYFRPAVRFGTDDRVLYILDFLVPVYRGNKSLLFVNAKFTPDNHHAWETNFGVGYRRLVMDDRLVLGGNLFYDHRKTRYNSHFDQIGLGFEAMAEPGGIGLTGRFNYYQPLTKAKLGDDFGYAFYGNGIYTAGIEEAMTGFDYEAGVRIPGISNYVETWAYAGGYHYFGCHTPDVNGFSARLEAFPTDFLRLDFEYRNDTVNNDEFYGEVAFEVPFSIDNLMAGKNPFEGIGDVLTGSRTLKERMVEPVHRDVDIVVGKDYLTGSDAVRYGTFMEGVIFVADNADTGGDGSYEHPYNNLSLANGDARLGDTISIVHVLTGDGTGLAGEFFTQAGITIWGAGANNPAYPNVANLVQGYPLITSTLTMDGQDQTILGLYFSYPGNAGIYVGPGAGGSTFSIFSNVIEGANGYGIYYDAGSIGADGSPVMIYDNRIYDTGGGFTAGISLNSSGHIYAEIFNNDIDSVISDGVSGIEVDCYGDFFGDISNNRIANIESYGSGSAYGILLNVYGDFTGSVANNDISGIYSYYESAGIYVWTGDAVFGSITGNRISTVDANGDYGNYAYAYGICAGGNDGFTGSIADNTITDIEAYDGEYTYAYGINGWVNSDFTGSITGNRITDVRADNGYYGTEARGIGTSNNGDYTGSISGNTISGISAYSDYGNARVYGIWTDVYNNGDFSGKIDNNTISSIFSDYFAAGIAPYASSGDLTGSISNNTITGVRSGNSMAEGIYFTMNGSFTGVISGNTISEIISPGYNATGIFVWSSSSLAGAITGNTLTGISAANTACGIYLGISSGGGDITTSVTDNVIKATGGNSAFGLYTTTNGILGTISSPMLFTGNTGSIDAPTAYLAYLYTTDPGASSVFIGHNRSVNNFTTTGAWGGNYPYAGGSIWATDNGSFINR